VIRDKNGDFEIGDPPMQSFDEQEGGGNGDAQEDESMCLSPRNERNWSLLIWHRGETEVSGCGEASSEG
jgi:hypothetical protein